MEIAGAIAQGQPPMWTSNDLFVDWSEFGELFVHDEPAWRALDRLPEFIDTRLQLAETLRGYTGLVLKPLVLHQNRVISDVVSVGSNGVVQLSGGAELAGAAVVMAGAFLADERILLGDGVRIEPGAYIAGPTVLGDGTEVRHGAYVRGGCLTGRHCVIGHASEIKNSVLFAGAKAPHLAYVGDSILGRASNLGAGTKLANLRLGSGTVKIRTLQGVVDTGRRKLGAIIGDEVQIGCNVVTSPGAVVGRGSSVMPGTIVSPRVYPPHTRIASPGVQ